MKYRLTRREAFKAAAGAIAAACLPGVADAVQTVGIVGTQEVSALHIDWVACWEFIDDFAGLDAMRHPWQGNPKLADLKPGIVRIRFRTLHGERGEHKDPWQTCDFKKNDDGTVDLPHGFVLHFPLPVEAVPFVDCI